MTKQSDPNSPFSFKIEQYASKYIKIRSKNTSKKSKDKDSSSIHSKIKDEQNLQMEINGQPCPSESKLDIHNDDISLRLPEKHVTVFTNDLEFSTVSVDETWRNASLIRSTHGKLEENQIV